MIHARFYVRRPIRVASACRVVLLLSVVMSVSASSGGAAVAADEAPPAIANLFSDSVTYFRVPEGSRLHVTFVAHRYQLEDAVLDIFAGDGARVQRVVFRSDSPELSAAAIGATQTVELPAAGTYKMVAYGPRFIYDLAFEGPEADWGLVVLGTPHVPPLRLADRAGALDLYFPVSGDFTLLAGGEWSDAPVRQHAIKVYDAADVERARLRVPTDREPDAFESRLEIENPEADRAFWRVRVEDASGGATPGAIGVWTDQGEYEHPQGPATLLAPAPEHYFVPAFDVRDVDVRLAGPSGRWLMPGTAGLPNEVVDPEDPVYATALERFRELKLKTIKHYTGWYWREGSPRERRNDDPDPFHIDWTGFNFGPFDARMGYMRQIGVRPLLCMDWASPYGQANVDFVGKPGTWDATEMAEYAEFVLATVIYAVAPDLVGPPLEREPYDIVGIQLMGEPNLKMSATHDLGTERDLILDQYTRILTTVVQRLRSHPDPRVSGVAIFTPGVAGDVWGGSQRRRWIGRLIEALPGEIAVVGWDPYSKRHLEELANYAADVREIRQLLEERGSAAEIGFFELGIHGGPPTFDNVYGSKHAQLYLFGTIANSANAGLTYPYYFSTVDAGNLNYKGLMGGAPEPDPPYTRFTTLDRKPQYYAMAVVGDIATGELLEVQTDDDQLDVLASFDGRTYRVGIQNRHEAPARLRLSLGQPCSCALATVLADGIQVLDDRIDVSGTLMLEMDAWRLHYVTCDRLPGRLFLPRADR